MRKRNKRLAKTGYIKLACTFLVLAFSQSAQAGNFRKKELAKTPDRESCMSTANTVLSLYKSGPWPQVNVRRTSNTIYAYKSGVPGDDFSDLVIYCLVYDGRSHPVIVGHTSANGKWLKEHIESVSYEFNQRAKKLTQQ